MRSATSVYKKKNIANLSHSKHYQSDDVDDKLVISNMKDEYIRYLASLGKNKEEKQNDSKNE